MTKLLALCGTAVAIVLYATPSYAQATRTWVSGVGDDVNPCSRTAPCKTFAGAISKTAPGGEINCLDPAGFGAVTITKSVTLDCTGTLGGMLASSTTGVIVNGANVVVNLRSLQINGGPPNLPGVNGIRFIQGARLHIDNVLVQNFLGAAPNGVGLQFAPSGASSLVVDNSYFVNNGTATTGAGIRIAPTGTGSARVTLNRVHVDNNAFGIVADAGSSTGGINITISDSVSASNRQDGILASTTGAAAPIGILVKNTRSTNNTFGIRSLGTGATIRVDGSSVIGNGTGLSFSGGGALLSYGNNNVDANGTDGTFSGSAALK